MTQVVAQDRQVSRFFSEFAEAWDTLYGGKRNAFWRAFDRSFRRDIYERYVLTFEHLGTDLAGRSVLDIGCGSGIYCFEAALRGAARVVGVDAAPGMIDLARLSAAKATRGDVCEFRAAQFPPAQGEVLPGAPYDHAIVMGVMDYVADAEALLAALRPVVSGSAVLSFPGKHWFRGPVRRWRYRLLGRCEVYTYDESFIRSACERAGFSRVEVTRLNHSGVCYIVVVHA